MLGFCAGLEKEGTVGLKASFATATPEAAVMLVYRVKSERQVGHTYFNMLHVLEKCVYGKSYPVFSSTLFICTGFWL